MLAIAAYAFNTVSETFIKHHVRIVAPKNTVLICRERWVDAGSCGMPVLEGVDPSPTPISSWSTVATAVRTVLRGRLGPRASSGQTRRLVAFLDAHDVTTVLAEYGGNGVFMAPACEKANIPLYVHFHGVDASSALRRRIWVHHYRRMFDQAAGIIVPSAFLANKLAAIGCPEAKLHVCPCGTDPELFRPTRRLPGRLIAIGRFVEKKAPHLTIEAFSRIAREFPETRLDMIGDGPLLEHCRKIVRKFGLTSRVHLHGAQPPDLVARMLSEASLFVQHSVTAPDGDTEGLGISILEAMASEVPIVATRHNGFIETVVNGETGLLVDEFDVRGMAEAMAELLADPVRAAKMGAAGRERVVTRYTHAHTRDRLRSIMGLGPKDSVTRIA